MAAKMSVLGLILSSYPYLRSAMVRFPINPINHHSLAAISKVTIILSLLTGEQVGLVPKPAFDQPKRKINKIFMGAVCVPCTNISDFNIQNEQ